MSQSYEVATTRQGHMAAVNLYRHHIKPHTQAGGAGRLTWEPVDTTTRAGMRRLFHGFILKDFASQTGYSVEAWKKWLTEKFCPPQLDDNGKELEKHTERMSDAQYATFLIEVQAFGAVDADIVFTEQES